MVKRCDIREHVLPCVNQSSYRTKKRKISIKITATHMAKRCIMEAPKKIKTGTSAPSFGVFRKTQA